MKMWLRAGGSDDGTDIGSKMFGHGGTGRNPEESSSAITYKSL